MYMYIHVNHMIDQHYNQINIMNGVDCCGVTHSPSALSSKRVQSLNRVPTLLSQSW